MNLLNKVFQKFPEETPEEIKKPKGQAIIVEDTPIQEYFPNEDEHENKTS